MTDNILEGRFYSTRPAWHAKGTIDDTYHTANDALGIIGELTFTKQPVYLQDYNVSTLEGLFNLPVASDEPTYTAIPDQFALVREASGKLPRKVMGIVSGDYEPITPRDAADQWDINVLGDDGMPRQIQTMGFLNDGATLFMSSFWRETTGPDGEATKQYLLTVYPLSGNGSAKIVPTTVRVVCANTLSMALSNAKAFYAVRHDKGAVQRLGMWLSTISRMADDSFAAMMAAYHRMARYQMSDAAINEVLDNLYSLTPLINDPMVPVSIAAEKNEAIAASNARQTQRREAVLTLFNGAMTGYNAANRGTAYGLFNSAIELANFANQRGMDATQESIWVGSRSREANAAYRSIMAVVDR